MVSNTALFDLDKRIIDQMYSSWIEMINIKLFVVRHTPFGHWLFLHLNSSIMSKTAIVLVFLYSLFNVSHSLAQTDTTDYVTPRNEQAPAPPPTPPSPKTPIKDKIYFGGNLGLSFGTVTSIAIEPLIGWKWTPKLSSGLVLSYWYFEDKRYTPSYKSSSYGYRLFTRYRVIPQAYLHVEWAQFFYDDIFDPEDLSFGPGNVPYLFVGGGLSQPLGGNAHMFFQLLYEVIQDERSVYRSNNDIYMSVGVAAGF